MSTRANIIIKESYSYTAKNGRKVTKTDQLFFYRHSDGYPEGALPTLNLFMEWLKKGIIRNNISQGSGWLILLGAMEYNSIPIFEVGEPSFPGAKAYGKFETIQDPEDWKCGAYEPTTGIHGDIQFLYVIDLTDQTLKVYDSWTEKGIGKNEVVINKSLIAERV